VEEKLLRVGVDGSTQVVENCESAGLCDPRTGCQRAHCVPDSLSCGGDEGNVVYRCQDGLAFVGTQKTCVSAARCEEGLGCAGAVRVTAGDAHSCALIVAQDAQDGAPGIVKCWGANEKGQLGNGAPLLADEPEARSVVFVDGNAPLAAAVFLPTGLCAGRTFSCADILLPSGGTGVACWGDNQKGQLGIGGPALEQVDRTDGINGIVRPVTDGTDAAPKDSIGDPFVGLHGVTCGADFACALDALGQIFCWGANDAGQLGTGQANRTSSGVATLVSGGILANGLFAGARHACALDRRNRVFCWGEGSKGQLGQEPSRQSPEPLRVGRLAATRLALGRDFTLAAPEDASDVLGFGENAYGQLATGNRISSNVPVTSVGLELARVSLLASGPMAAHTCAIRDQSLVCWGANPLGQLGDGTRIDRTQPAPVIEWSRTEAAGTSSSLALGRSHTCAIDSEGGIWCFGANHRKQLGFFPLGVGSLTGTLVY
jgi:alpha-tubulin suppressor-like RCC1 family protein